MASNIVWGLDIGSSAIKAVKMQRSGTECSIVDFDIIDIPGGDDPAERPARLSIAMKSLIESHKFGKRSRFSGDPRSRLSASRIHAPAGARKRASTRWSASRPSSRSPSLSTRSNGATRRFEGGDDNKAINVTLIAVRKSDIQELLTLSENFNLKLAGIAAAPVSLYRHSFTTRIQLPQQITLILDAGARGTDFVVMNKRQIYFRSIQIAGREITRVLENKFKVPYEKAESLKKNIEKSPQMDQILTVIEPTLRNLGADVQRTIGFYKAKSRGQKIQQCYLLGHAFRLPKMAEYLQAQVREAPPFALVEGLQRIRLAGERRPDRLGTRISDDGRRDRAGHSGAGLERNEAQSPPTGRQGTSPARAVENLAAVVAAVVLIAALVANYYMVPWMLSPNIPPSVKALTKTAVQVEQIQSRRGQRD